MQVQYVVRGATLKGVEAVPVDVEVLISNGLPSFSIVGMPDAAVQEARERVRAAIRACGFSMPGEKVVVNLAPGSLKKTGSGFDLPIAVGLLAATKQIPTAVLERSLIVGELSLEGQVRPVNGLLAYAFCARDCGFDLICAQPAEGVLDLQGIEQFSVDALGRFRTAEFDRAAVRPPAPRRDPPDFADLAGHDAAKRALQVAAAGGHGVLMMGPPGSGKTMLASRLPSILPPLDEDEMVETALIHSVAGNSLSDIFAGIRPFRSPHHSASLAGLVGGGSPLRPGEASFAHNGVLFLDELAEFKPSTLQGIRQPMESGAIAITRAEGVTEFPARFMLVAATNPCPCGHFGDPDIRCTCTAPKIRTYQNRIGGPLMDRIDIHIDVWRSDPDKVLRSGRGKDSRAYLDAVLRAREYARYRARGDKPGQAGSAKLLHDCALEFDDEKFLEEMAGIYHMSGRGIMRTLAIARTVADMEASSRVRKSHICEALNLRVKEGVGALS